MTAPAGACAPCLRRAWLLERLSGWIEVAHLSRRPVRDVLALGDERMIAALAGEATGVVRAEHAAFDAAAAAQVSTAAGLWTTCRHCPAYPSRLHDEDRSSPHALHVLGERGRLAELVGDERSRPPAVGIVGTRRASPDGMEVARGIARGLAAAGVTVVSGMARGIDSAAHEGALLGGGATVAVLGGAAERPYPRSGAALHARIARGGAVVAELPPAAAVRRWTFPARNRLIAALCDVLVVVEAAERSGSLITAGMALELGREVCAVPGPVRAWRSSGTNGLLRDGATLVRDARDVLDAVLGPEFVPAPVAPAIPRDLSPRLAALLRRIDDGADTLGALARTPDEAAHVATGLGELELLGLVRRAAGGRYLRVLAA